MSARELVSKYVASAERAFGELEIEESGESEASKVKTVLNSARHYLVDAKYYRDRGEFEVSLTSIAYCEGLLDALRLLGLVKFEWTQVPT